MPRSGNIRALTTRSRSSADTSATSGGVFSKQTLPTGIATRPSPLKQQCGESVTRTDSRGLRGPALQPSLPDTSHGHGHLLVAFPLTIERQPAFSKVVEPSTDRIRVGCRPIESVGFQSCVLVGNVAATQQGIEEIGRASCRARVEVAVAQ